MKYIEILALILNVICVYFIIKRKTINWIIGILGILLLIIVFINANLWGQVLVQIIFLFQSLYGYVKWNKNETQKKEVQIQMLTMTFFDVIALYLFYVGCLVFMVIIEPTYLDYALLAISIAAMDFLARRYIENWGIWIIVDAFSIVLFIKSGIYWTAFLYFIMLIMCVIGFLQWDKELKQSK